MKPGALKLSFLAMFLSGCTFGCTGFSAPGSTQAGPAGEWEALLPRLDIPEGSHLVFLAVTEKTYDWDQGARSAGNLDSLMAAAQTRFEETGSQALRYLLQAGFLVHSPQEVTKALEEVGRPMGLRVGSLPDESVIRTVGVRTGATHIVFAEYVFETRRYLDSGGRPGGNWNEWTERYHLIDTSSKKVVDSVSATGRTEH